MQIAAGAYHSLASTAGGHITRAAARSRAPAFAKTHGNAGKPACARVVADGSLRLRAGTGANQLRFEGRISPARKLKSGRYTVLFTATSRADKSSAPQSHSFTIAAP